MGLVIATLFIMYGPLLFAYRASTLGLATKEDAIASLFITLVGLYLMLSIALTYENIVFGANREAAAALPIVQPLEVPTLIQVDQSPSEGAGKIEVECLEEWGSL